MDGQTSIELEYQCLRYKDRVERKSAEYYVTRILGYTLYIIQFNQRNAHFINSDFDF